MYVPATRTHGLSARRPVRVSTQLVDHYPYAAITPKEVLVNPQIR